MGHFLIFKVAAALRTNYDTMMLYHELHVVASRMQFSVDGFYAWWVRACCWRRRSKGCGCASSRLFSQRKIGRYARHCFLTPYMVKLEVAYVGGWLTDTYTSIKNQSNIDQKSIKINQKSIKIKFWTRSGRSWRSCIRMRICCKINHGWVCLGMPGDPQGYLVTAQRFHGKPDRK